MSYFNGELHLQLTYFPGVRSDSTFNKETNYSNSQNSQYKLAHHVNYVNRISWWRQPAYAYVENKSVKIEVFRDCYKSPNTKQNIEYSY